MNIKQHTGVDIKFEDVPDECKIYTYLHSQATVLHYNDNKCTIWDEHGVVRLVFPVHLDADKEKLQERCELFARYIQSIKREKPVDMAECHSYSHAHETESINTTDLHGQIEEIMRNYTIINPTFVDNSDVEWEDDEIDDIF